MNFSACAVLVDSLWEARAERFMSEKENEKKGYLESLRDELGGRSGLTDDFGQLVLSISDLQKEVGAFEELVKKSGWNDEDGKRYGLVRQYVKSVESEEDRAARAMIAGFFEEGQNCFGRGDYGSAAASWQKALSLVRVYYERLQHDYPEHTDSLEFAMRRDQTFLTARVKAATIGM